eukprot:scaffold35284_cov77-Phaeocystis_antarctica.AAC.2
MLRARSARCSKRASEAQLGTVASRHCDDISARCSRSSSASTIGSRGHPACSTGRRGQRWSWRSRAPVCHAAHSV